MLRHISRAYDCTIVLVGDANSFLLKNSIKTPILKAVPVEDVKNINVGDSLELTEPKTFHNGPSYFINFLTDIQKKISLN